MPLAIFPSPSDQSVLVFSVSRQPARPVSVVRFFPSMTEQRSSFADREFNQWPSGVGLDVTDAGRETIEAFLSARTFAKDSWLFEDPLSKVRGPNESIALDGVVDGVNKEFTLLTTGRFAGDYPINDIPNTIIDVDGSPVTVDAIDPDTRKFTLNVAPTGGQVVTADRYRFYYRVRLISGQEPDWTYVHFNRQQATMFIEEVVA